MSRTAVAAAAVAVLSIAAACSSPPAEIEPVAARLVAPVPTVPRTCDVMVYTPPTATQSRVGELCTPRDPNGEVVLLVHGGGGYTGAPEQTDSWRDEHLTADRATFTIDYALLDLAADGEGALWPLAEQNVKAAVQFARMDEGLGARVILLHGFSAGARLGGIVATTADDPLFAGDELWPGVSDAVDGAILFYGYHDGSQFEADQYYGGSTIPVGASAGAEADADDAPVLLVHGSTDTTVDAAQSTDFAATVDAVGGVAVVVVVEDEEHAFDGYGWPRLTEAGAELVGDIDSFVFDVRRTFPQRP